MIFNRKKQEGEGERISLEERIRRQKFPGFPAGCDRLEGRETRSGVWPDTGDTENVYERITLEDLEQENDQEDMRPLENEAVTRTLERMKKKFGERIKTERSQAAFREELRIAIEDALKDEGRAVPTIEKRDQMTERICNLIVGLGPLEVLFHAGYSEIMVSRYDRIFYEDHGKMCLSNVRFENEEELRSVLERIVSPIGRTIDDMTPLVDGRLEDGSRINAVIPPISIDGSLLTIRRFPEKDLKPEDYLAYGSLDENILQFLKIAVEARLNLIVSGGTGSGKTSLLNLMGNFLSYDPGLSVVTIEDSAELRISHPNVRRLETRAATAEGKGVVTSRMLVKNTMRMRPDIIIIGEIRDGTIVDYFREASSGHDGCMTTIHSDSPEELESTVQILFQMAEDYNFSESAIRRLYANAVDIIIQIQRFPDHVRRISKITHVVGYGKRAASVLGISPTNPEYSADEVYLKDIFTWEKTGVNQDGTFKGVFRATGYVPEAVVKKSLLYGVEMNTDIFIRKEIA